MTKTLIPLFNLNLEIQQKIYLFNADFVVLLRSKITNFLTSLEEKKFNENRNAFALWSYF